MNKKIISTSNLKILRKKYKIWKCKKKLNTEFSENSIQELNIMKPMRMNY